MGIGMRTLDLGLTKIASALWPLVERANLRFPASRFRPRWASAAIPRSFERSRPPLGWPRVTDSLCPLCVKEVRAAVVAGERSIASLTRGRPGEVEATIVERDGHIVMEKHCRTHGTFEDLLSIDPAFMARIEGLFPGRDAAGAWTLLRDHGSSAVKWGRGAVLTVDLTNRCNMMCEPCFMDANQVGYVHELSFDDVKKILDDSLSIEPRRQLSVQFSGGEPTLSPIFIDSVRYAKDIGYFCVQAATNGIAFAQSQDFAHRAAEAGLRLAYLQFDGVGEEANSHRKVPNLYEVKQRAIENMAAAGIDVVLVPTILNNFNEDHVGRIVQFAIDNADKVTVVSFQPVSFTGRDEDISDEDRRRHRYTLSHLVHDLHEQLGCVEPLRDWFPLSTLVPFSALTDRLYGQDHHVGMLACGCHPSCGVGTVLLVHKQTGETVPLTRFLDLEQLIRDVDLIADGHRSRSLSLAEATLALLRNYDPTQAPKDFNFATLVRQFLSQTGVSSLGDKSDAAEFDYRLLFVAGMWFQDLFNYDFRRSEMCIIPYGTQEGEIPFCAYNTGLGWRSLVESAHKNTTTKEWYRKHGKHTVYANPKKPVPLPGREPASHLELVATDEPDSEDGAGARDNGASGNGRGAFPMSVTSDPPAAGRRPRDRS